MQLQHKETCLGQHIPCYLGQNRHSSMKLHTKAMLDEGCWRITEHIEVSILQEQKD